MWEVILGGIITLVCSRHYYVEASKQLGEESEKLRNETVEVQKLIKSVIHYFEAKDAGKEVRFNEFYGIEYHIDVGGGSLTPAGQLEPKLIKHE